MDAAEHLFPSKLKDLEQMSAPLRDKTLDRLFKTKNSSTAAKTEQGNFYIMNYLYGNHVYLVILATGLVTYFDSLSAACLSINKHKGRGSKYYNGSSISTLYGFFSPVFFLSHFPDTLLEVGESMKIDPVIAQKLSKSYYDQTKNTTTNSKYRKPGRPKAI